MPENTQMARKFDVIEADGSRGPQLKRCVAQLLVRRQVAVLVAPFVIRRLAISEQPTILPKAERVARHWKPREYAHHIEPHINPLTIDNSEWLRYLHGYQTIG